MSDVVLIYSGGLDSTVLLYYLKQQCDVLALSFDYSQRHRKELSAARLICDDMGVSHRVLDISSIFTGLVNNCLTGTEMVPEGHYSSENMKTTVVPNRNMIFLSVATAHAINREISTVAYAGHKGDHPIYPDCRPQFAEAMHKAMQQTHYTPIELLSPFMGKDKIDIVKLGDSLGVPFEKTWSCYKGGRKHCGKCGTCVERREAFQLSGVVDPTKYE